MKTEFELTLADGNKLRGTTGYLKIIGLEPNSSPYVAICTNNPGITMWIADKDLERFAVNILKALKSEKLKP